MNPGLRVQAAVRTDLAILELSGSTIEELGDHLVVRTPANPTFHWGNCLYVLATDRVDDATGWLAAFADAFPGAPRTAPSDWCANPRPTASPRGPAPGSRSSTRTR